MCSMIIFRENTKIYNKKKTTNLIWNTLCLMGKILNILKECRPTNKCHYVASFYRPPLWVLCSKNFLSFIIILVLFFFWCIVVDGAIHGFVVEMRIMIVFIVELKAISRPAILTVQFETKTLPESSSLIRPMPKCIQDILLLFSHSEGFFPLFNPRLLSN